MASKRRWCTRAPLASGITSSSVVTVADSPGKVVRVTSGRWTSRRSRVRAGEKAPGRPPMTMSPASDHAIRRGFGARRGVGAAGRCRANRPPRRRRRRRRPSGPRHGTQRHEGPYGVRAEAEGQGGHEPVIGYGQRRCIRRTRTSELRPARMGSALDVRPSLFGHNARRGDPQAVTDVLVLCYHAVSPTWPAALSVTRKRCARRCAACSSPATSQRPSAPQFRPVAAPHAGRDIRRRLPLDDRVGPARWRSSACRRPYSSRRARGPPGADGVGRDRPPARGAAPLRAALMSAPSSRSCRRPLGVGSTRAPIPASRGWVTASSPSGSAAPAAPGGPAGGRGRWIAYPSGDADRRVAEAAQAQGYDSGAGLSPYHSGSDPMLWPRIGCAAPTAHAASR